MLIDPPEALKRRLLLFKVAMRGIPIFTFVNKMDSSKDLDLMDELEAVLGIRPAP